METHSTQWRGLYQTGAWAAIAVLVLMPVQMAVFIAYPIPNTVADWFALFQQHALIGLLDMDLLLIVDYVFIAVVVLAVCAALHLVSRSLTTLALLFELLGLAAYFSSATAMEMLALSRAHAEATTDIDRSALIAAARAELARWDGTAFTVSYELSAVALLLIGSVMLRSAIFAKAGGYAAVAAGVCSLVPANAGTPGLLLSLAALPPTAVWLGFTSKDLFRLSRSAVDASVRCAPTPPPMSARD